MAVNMEQEVKRLRKEIDSLRAENERLKKIASLPERILRDDGPLGVDFVNQALEREE